MDYVSWLGVVRHGESEGNVAARTADADRLDRFDLADRDADVELSDLGRDQAAALGKRFAALDADAVPEVAVSSPFRRARQTAELALAGLDLPVRTDERLRDRDLGVFDLHTAAGIRSAFPDEAERRRRHGKFYYRPPGGESWTDVALRLRSILRDLHEEHAGRRVILFAHDAVVSLVRYLIEGLDEETLLADARSSPIGNASLTSWARRDGRWVREYFNDVSHLEDTPGVRPTREEPADVPR